MAKAKVSAAFSKFIGAKADVIEEAKKAENTMSSGPAPVGWKGQCILLEATADKGKDKKNPDGTTREGNPYIRFRFGIVGDDNYQGKHFDKMFVFFDSHNAKTGKSVSAGDRYTWFLNQMEIWGCDRELRERHDDPSELLDWMLNSGNVYNVECVQDDYSQDKKAMNVTLEASVDSTDSATAPPRDTTTTTSTATPENWPQAGDEVIFLANQWKVVSREGGQVKLSRNDDEGNELSRTAMVDKLQPVK